MKENTDPLNPQVWIEWGRATLEQEIQALAGFADSLGDEFANACMRLYSCRGTIVLTGMGKSGIVARKWASTLSSTGTTSYFLNPAEAQHGDLGILRAGDLLVALSMGGETEELGFTLRHARELGLGVIAVTGKETSSLAKSADLVLPVRVDERACPLGLAPMSSSTAMMALGDALAATLMRMRGFTSEDFARLHPGGSLGRKLWLRVSELMHQGEAVPRVHRSDSLEVVLLEMTRKSLGLAVVFDGDAVCGVITDGDVRRHFQRTKTFHGVIAETLMSHNPKTISVNALAAEAREVMETNAVQQLIVHDAENRLVGVIHLYQLMRAKVL